jgi:hypothetical protein
VAGAGLAVSSARTADDLPLAGEAVPGCPWQERKAKMAVAQDSRLRVLYMKGGESQVADPTPDPAANLLQK